VSGASDALVGRFTTTGAPDVGFSPQGYLTRTWTLAASPAAIAVLPDGGSLVAGTNGTGVNADFAFQRFTASGLNYTGSFGGCPTTTSFVSQIGAADDRLNAMAVAPDGGFVAVGTSGVPGSNDIGVGKYNPDGTPDLAFGGGDGKLLTAIGGNGALGSGVVLQGDGRVVASASVVRARRRFKWDSSAISRTAHSNPSFGNGGVALIPPMGNERQLRTRQAARRQATRLRLGERRPR